MSLLKNSFFILLAGLSLACQRKAERLTNTFFNVDSLINAQVIYLGDHKPDLYKEASLSGEKDSVLFNDLDTTALKKELETFHQLDLNIKPVNRENYDIRKGIPDPQSNLLFCEYTAKKKLPLKVVKIYYQNSLSTPKKIEGEIVEQNGLYSSIQHLILELNEINKVTLLTQYEITGGQKMILGDSVEFKIKGVLTHRGE